MLSHLVIVVLIGSFSDAIQNENLNFPIYSKSENNSEDFKPIFNQQFETTERIVKKKRVKKIKSELPSQPEALFPGQQQFQQFPVQQNPLQKLAGLFRRRVTGQQIQQLPGQQWTGQQWQNGQQQSSASASIGNYVVPGQQLQAGQPQFPGQQWNGPPRRPPPPYMQNQNQFPGPFPGQPQLQGQGQGQKFPGQQNFGNPGNQFGNNFKKPFLNQKPFPGQNQQPNNNQQFPGQQGNNPQTNPQFPGQQTNPQTNPQQFHQNNPQQFPGQQVNPQQNPFPGQPQNNPQQFQTNPQSNPQQYPGQSNPQFNPQPNLLSKLKKSYVSTFHNLFGHPHNRRTTPTQFHPHPNPNWTQFNHTQQPHPLVANGNTNNSPLPPWQQPSLETVAQQQQDLSVAGSDQVLVRRRKIKLKKSELIGRPRMDSEGGDENSNLGDGSHGDGNQDKIVRKRRSNSGYRMPGLFGMEEGVAFYGEKVGKFLKNFCCHDNQ